jgi:hypothetical protein
MPLPLLICNPVINLQYWCFMKALTPKQFNETQMKPRNYIKDKNDYWLPDKVWMLNISRHAFTTSLGAVFSGNDNDISSLAFLLLPASPLLFLCVRLFLIKSSRPKNKQHGHYFIAKLLAFDCQNKSHHLNLNLQSFWFPLIVFFVVLGTKVAPFS